MRRLIFVPVLVLSSMAVARADGITVHTATQEPCVVWGTEKLKAAIHLNAGEEQGTIEVSVASSADALPETARKPEGFALSREGDSLRVVGYDGPGAMYGCLELARQIRALRRLPEKLDEADAPTMSLRGTCILLMKLGLYDYPVTPKEFPFFYDKALWQEYLDFLAENRFNYVAFWNGHPFDYFVKLDQYPEAQDGLEPGLLERNHDMLMWLAQEAQKRNIWLMFEFYNIHVSVYFAKAHHLPEHGIDAPTPLLRDYTGYCIERFVSEFPSVGLYICPGEALQMQYTPDWINNVIFAAVKRTGKTPPIMVRSWGIDLEHMKQVVGNYPRLYTERKFNVEMIADTRIDPENADWAKLSGNHVVNIHCVANLEPFRWSPPSYIQKCVQSSLAAGGTGLHLYPRKAWRWPYGCDKVDKPELQWHRDWMWFETWGRYAWNANRDPEEEKKFWTRRLEEHFGPAAGKPLLGLIEESGKFLPILQSQLWIGNDNHTVVSAGATLEQIQKAPGIPFLDIGDGNRVAKRNERLISQARSGKQVPPAENELPLERMIPAAGARRATANRQEAERLIADIWATNLICQFYEEKIRAAECKTLLDSGVNEELSAGRCLRHLRRSLEAFRELTKLTSLTYESISDVPAWNPSKELPCPYHWLDVFPLYEAEYVRIEKELKGRFPALAGERAPAEAPSIGNLEDYLLWSGTISEYDCIPWLVHDCQRRLPRITSSETWRRHKEEIQKRVAGSLGLDPMQAKTALNVQVTGTLDYPDYTLEKIVYEAWPGIPVPAHLYLPKNPVAKPLPCVLYACGHWYNGKTEKEPRAFCVGMARNGIAVLIYDPMGQGERFAKDEHGHLFPILVGLSQEGFMVWESMRAIDYLETRTEIDPKRIGMTGASGGGLNTVFTAAVEERLAAVAPVCYPVTYEDFLRAMDGRHWNGAVDLCNQVPGIIAYADTSDLMACAAPRPQCQISATHDLNFPIGGARETAAKVKMAYNVVARGQFSFVEIDAEHGYDKAMREAAYGFFLKTLAKKGDGSPVAEVPIELESWDEPKLRCFPDGQNHAPGALLETLVRSILARGAAPSGQATSESIRQVCMVPGFALAPLSEERTGNHLDEVRVWKTVERVYRAGSASGCVRLAIDMLAERKRHNWDDQERGRKALPRRALGILSNSSRQEPPRDRFPELLKDVLNHDLNTYAPLLSGVLKNMPNTFELATDLWMLGLTLAGQRISDIESAAKEIKEQDNCGQLFLFADETTAETALLAAACIPGIDGVVVDGPLITYRDLINCKVRWDASVYIPSVLKYFDLPQVIAAIAPRKVVLINPVNGLKEPYEEAAASRILEPVFRAYREAGVADSFKVLYGVANEAKARIVCEMAEGK